MPRVPPKKLSHVVYRTHRYQAMVEWYQAVFGARVKSASPTVTFMTFDDEDHRLAIANLDALRPEHREPEQAGLVGLDHVAYTYERLADLFANYVYLRDLGITPYWCIHHGDTVSMYYADPDGNQMEFQVETFEAQRRTPPVATGVPRKNNPIGVEYDPEAWLRALEAGTPEDELLVRKTHEPVSPIRGAMARG